MFVTFEDYHMVHACTPFSCILWKCRGDEKYTYTHLHINNL